ncbi:MAG: S8 family serine peptidase [Tepidisphaerales bacterium]
MVPIEILEERLVLSAAFDVTGLTALRNDPTYSSIDGSGVGIAILDSGVYAQNPDLQSNVVAYYNAVENNVPASIDSSSVASASDHEGHGTHVSGIAASSNPDIGVAYKAQLIDVKVIPDSGESQIGGDPLLRGLQFVAQYADQFNIKVVNMSLGEADQSGGLNLNSVPNADDISREIQDLEGLGITVVSAAGNSYANDPVPGESYPAVVSTIAVSSTWADNGPGYNFNIVAWGSAYDNYAAFEQSAAADRFSATSQRSTLGNEVAAPGVDIYSTWNNSSAGSAGGNLLYNTLSGTSMAAPFVSGVVALIQDAAHTFGGRYITDPTQVRQIIQQTADVIVDSNVPDNGRVPLVNGQPDTSQTLNLPETGLTYYRVNVQKAIQYVRQLFTGGTISTADLDNTTATATSIPALTGIRFFTGRGNIGTDGLNQVGVNDVDLYKITLDSPGVVSVILSQPSGGSAFAAEIRLFDAQGNQITAATGTAGAYPTLTSDTNNPLAIGTYYIGISGSGNASYNINDGSGAAGGSTTGDYALIIGLSNPDPNGVAQGATVVDLTNPNTTISGNVVANKYQGAIGSDPPPAGSTTRIPVPNGDVDMFKVLAPDSGVLTVQTNTSAYRFVGFPPVNLAVDSYVRVFDANLNQIAFNDDISATDTDSYVQVPVQSGQTYYVAVTNYANRNFDVRNPYGRVPNSTPSDRYYDLYLSFDNGDTDGTAFLATPEGVGQTVANAIGTDNGQPLLGANGGNKDVDFYTYTAPSDGLLDFGVNATTGGFSPSLELWSLTASRTSISELGVTTGSGNHLIAQVSAGDTLYVSVTGKGNESFNWYSLGSGTGGQTGGYTLSSQLRPLSDYAALSDGAIQNGTPQTLTVNTPVYGNLGMDGPLIVGAADVDIYRLNVTETGEYNIRTDTSSEGSADTVLRLFDASGNQLAVNDNLSDATTASLITATLTAGHTYYIGVSGAGTGATAYDPNTGAGAAAGSTGSYGLVVTRDMTPALSVAAAAPVREPLPGQTAGLTFTVTLDPAAAAPVTVDYATADGSAVAGRDFTAASNTLTFAPGETSKTVTITILSDTFAAAAETFTLVLSNASANAIVFNGSSTGTIQDLAAKTVTFSGARAGQYVDVVGHKVTLQLSGPGSGSAVFYGGSATPSRITLTGTTGRSTFTISPDRGGTTVGDVVVNGSLLSISAGKAALGGDLSVTGSLGSVVVIGALGGHTLSIGSGAVAASLSLGNVFDLSVSAAGALKTVTATAWQNLRAGNDAINAASIGSLTVPGVFAADLILSAAGLDIGTASLGTVTGGTWTLGGSATSLSAGSTAAGWSATAAGDITTFSTTGRFSGQLTARSLGTVRVGASLTGAHLRATAAPGAGGKTPAVGQVIVKGAISGSEIRSAGNIQSVSAATLVDSRIFAGVADAITGLPASAGDLSADAIIGTVNVVGVASQPFAVSNSDIAAATVQQVILGKLKTTNGGTPFGVAARHIVSYRRQVGSRVLVTSSAAAHTASDGGDAVFRMLT